MTISDHDPWWTRTARHDLTAAQTDATFFPLASNNKADIYVDARAYCNRCPVAPDCLADVLKREVGGGRVSGFYGGRTPRERADLRKVRVAG